VASATTRSAASSAHVRMVYSMEPTVHRAWVIARDVISFSQYLRELLLNPSSTGRVTDFTTTSVALFSPLF